MNDVVHRLFELQVSTEHDSIAIEHHGLRLTYGELNCRANQLGRFLLNQGVGPDRVVGICLDRSVNMVVALLGIMKAGGAYLPLDPNYPKARLQHMLEDASPELVLTETELAGLLPSWGGKQIILDREIAVLSGFICENLDAKQCGVDSESLVYVIYTSGSTGRPKGIAMPHRAMVNLIEWHRSVFGTSAGQRVVQFASLNFDVAFQEIFTTFCTGGTLVLIDEWVRRDSKALAEFLDGSEINRIFVPPVMLQSIAEHYRAGGRVPECLRDIIVAGEQLRISSAIRELFRGRNSCTLHNHYGPAETHVVTALSLKGDPGAWEELPPIGRPIANTQIRLLDEEMRPVSAGSEGEIYISGCCVARGYLHHPDLTRERFIANPYSADQTSRLYRSGDLGRWGPNGLLEYLGRNDDQVKIRGFRVELGEIEAQLARHEEVGQVVVVAKEISTGEKYIAAYVVPRGEPFPSSDELRIYLKGILPDYMVPRAFVMLKELPLTPTGKIDRRSLPEPDLSILGGQDYEPPCGEREKILAEVWQELLGLRRVGRGDDFFEIGGHSLAVARAVNRLRELGLSADAVNIYAHPTLAAFAETLRDSEVHESQHSEKVIPIGCAQITPAMLDLIELEPAHIQRIVRSVPGGTENVKDIYPLAPLQEGILFHHLLNGEQGDPYVLPILFSTSSQEALDRFIVALQSVIDRHDSLRTGILWEHLPKPIQVVYRKAQLPITIVTSDGVQNTFEQIRNHMRPERQRMDLHRAPLMRLQVLADPRGARCYALLQVHHLAADHESLETVLAESVAQMENRTPDLPAPIPYRKYVAKAMMPEKHREAEKFFSGRLARIDEPTAPYGVLDIYGNGSELEHIAEPLSSESARRIRLVSRRLAVGPTTVFHAAWALVMAHLSGRSDVVFGTLLLGRLQSGTEGIPAVGMYINTLPLTLELGNHSARDLMKLTHRELAELLRHEQASVSMARACSGLPASAPLFTTLLNYRYAESYLDRVRSMRNGVELIELREWTNYPIAVSIDDEGKGFSVTLQARRPLNPRRILEYFLTAVDSLLTSVEADSALPALTLGISPGAERRQIVEVFNRTRATYSGPRLFHQIVENQARQRATSVAATCSGQSVTYSDLNRRANQLAWHLSSRGVGPGHLVGLCVERGLDMLVGLLGIMKSGAAYLPLDPTYPAARLSYMLEDAAPRVVVTKGNLVGALPRSAAIIALDADWAVIGVNRGDELPASDKLSPRSLAYVIYTSGSTGRPKGVMVEHAGLSNLAHMQGASLGIGPESRVLQFASLSFDACIWEISMALAHGARLCMAPLERLLPGDALIRTLRDEEITHATLPPSVLMETKPADDLSLKVLVAAGEACTQSVVSAWGNGRRLINAYGPTEITVCATMHECGRDASGSVPIGCPIPNARIYILDDRGQIVPLGVTGEIYVGGAGVARGYLNRPELTAERFVRDPFGPGLDDRLYKTGDLGAWRADGAIDYAGRKDGQIKIRGFRIELGEIESQLRCVPEVRDAVVLVREDVPGDKRLVAYVVPSVDIGSCDAEKIRNRLATSLPQHMIPAAFMSVERLPLTSNGKVDRSALPAPASSSYVRQDYEAPKGQVEADLAGIWERLLRADRIGRNDNFFELGGDSLVATRFIAHVGDLFDVEIPMRTIFERPALRQLADFVLNELAAETSSEAL